ncbi:MAG: NAD(+) synthetase [Candidatus Omnitrophica bacterium CG23_combo_of_CG06-09_8_20_14_all_40_11]|nr:MAG: NAD(+) synthetase [Candidatus Omnitrophica bacterium CG23_combo_of_CG06-09_8_20_14_all_40_11]
MKKKIIFWMRKQLKDSGAKGIVMGLSGGVDSAVVAALAKEAFGKGRVLALILPCHSQVQGLKDALLVARQLGIETKTLDLSDIYDNLIRILPEAGRRALANLKPRLRMSVLYYFANKFNYLVCGTGNKSEIKVGYFTKHGDGATDILPIGDLLKRDVRKLAKQLGIPTRIITKSPTAGLWPGQTDEGEMGITYPELDDILERLENKKRQVLSKKKINKVKEMIKRSEHKRQGPKICYI